MPTKRKPPLSETELNPICFYRKYSNTALKVVGLGPTQMEEALERGELPPLVRPTKSGRTVGWYGSQLIELQRQRLAEAEAAANKRTT